MQCKQFETQIQDRLDQRVSLSTPSLLQHAQGCPDCRRLFAAYQELQSLAMPSPQVERAESPRELAHSLRWGVLVAAICLVAFSWWPRDAQQSLPSQPSGSTMALQQRPARQPFLGDEPSPKHGGYLMHQPILSLHLLAQGDWSATIASVDMPFGAELPEMQTQWVSAVATGMTPLQQSFVTTLDLIRRTVSPGTGKGELRG